MNGHAADTEVPVLVVGGSLVGLSTAMLLAQHGVQPLVVERHSGTAIHPRAGHFNLRTLEILRSAGLEDTVRRRSREQYPPDGGISNVESLAGREIGVFFADLNAGVAEFSPTIRLFINQDAHRHPRDLRAQPGSRAPHVFLNRDGARVSTLDLFGRNFVLLAGPRGGPWPEAARTAAERLGVGLDAYQVAGADEEAPADGILTGDGNRFRSAYRMAPDGAVLVRPDGYVAWRAADGTRATTEVMTAVLSRVLHREGA